MEENLSEDTESLLNKLAGELLEQREAKTVAAKILSETNEQIDKLESKLLEIMGVLGRTTFDWNGNLFSQHIRPIPRILSGQAERFNEWLEANNEDGIIKRTVNAKTLESWWKQNEFYHEELEKEKVIEVFDKVSVHVRKK